MTRRAFWLALASVEGIGPVRINRLLSRFGSVEKVFDAKFSEIVRLPLFSPELASRVIAVRERLGKIRRQMEWLESQGVEILCSEDANYPDKLRTISNAPPVVYKRGKLRGISRKAIAIVGSTRPTEVGVRTTLALSKSLAQAGFTVVSGFAKGIDTAAHIGALSVGGTTVGVFGGDLFSIYPRENRPLAARVYDSGMLLSEHPFATRPTPANLILRNRIISGLSVATIVVEARQNGGAVRTASYALEQGRAVLAYDWQKRHLLSEGPRHLLQRGAIPLTLSQLKEIQSRLLKPELLTVQPRNSSLVEQMQLF
ncbi:MAG: DNA-processing protein DprA [Candidatus Poribacteria bacterium]|nr:DNA-processing protein DprA [Candidatus Poribacteria bacterium]